MSTSALIAFNSFLLFSLILSISFLIIIIWWKNNLNYLENKIGTLLCDDWKNCPIISKEKKIKNLTINIFVCLLFYLIFLCGSISFKNFATLQIFIAYFITYFLIGIFFFFISLFCLHFFWKKEFLKIENIKINNSTEYFQNRVNYFEKFYKEKFFLNFSKDSSINAFFWDHLEKDFIEI